MSGRAPAGHVNLLALVHRHIAIGPEIGYCAPGIEQQFAEGRYARIGRKEVLYAGASAYLLLNRWRIRPFVQAGVAGYSWNHEFVGFNAGAGLALALGSVPDRLSIECRWHRGFWDPSNECFPQIFTAAVGVRAVSW